MSEMELSLLRQRSFEALHQKARRGELFFTVAVGYRKVRHDRIEIDPDLRVREAFTLVFRKFDEFHSVRQVHLWLRQEEIRLPAVEQCRHPSFAAPGSERLLLAVTTPISDGFAKWPFYSGIAVLSIVCTIYVLPSVLRQMAVLFGYCGPFDCLYDPRAAVSIALVFFFVFLSLLVPVVVLLGAAIWCAAVALFRRKWRRALSMVAFPLTVVLIVPATEVTISARDELRFLIHKSGYDTLVAKAKAEGKQYIVVDDWSIFVTANSFVVWDAWDKPEEVVQGLHPYQRFGGHFYLVGD